ncbi:hypothetical protein ACWA5Z_03790 [Testudinibacter sp. P80/BLE/0925]|uniref:hypothetical protein n=1 Tax=Testudinibacter sp. TW-1 TaxID=3417757 RepID=UPI003D36157C
MILKLKTRLTDLLAQIWPLAKKYPLEMLWMVLFSLPFLFFDLFDVKGGDLLRYWLFAPAFFALSYLLHRYKIAYWLTAVMVPLVLFWQLNNGLILEDYLEDRRFAALQLLLLLCLLARGWAQENRTFITRFLQTALNIAKAWLINAIGLLLFFALLGSVELLFNLDLPFDRILQRILPFTYFSIFPLFFLLFEQNKDTEQVELGHFGQLLLNFVLSPTLIIYSLLLYLYSARIVLLGEMPQGQISYIVLPYLLLGLALKSVQLLQTSPKWQGFYHIFGWIALLPLALLWFAVYQRLSAYGLTEVRVYLLALTVLISLFIALSLRTFNGQHRTFASLIALTIILLGWVLNPKEIAFDNQLARFDRQLQQFDLLDAQGKIKALPDTAAQAGFSEQQRQDYHNLSTQARNLNWIYARRGQINARYGQHFPELAGASEDTPQIAPNVIQTLHFYHRENVRVITLKHPYQTMLSVDYSLDSDTVAEAKYRYRFAEHGIHFEVDLNGFINQILLKNGFALKTQYPKQELQPLNDQFLLLQGENFLLLFSRFSLRYDKTLGYVFAGAHLESVLQ